MQTSGSKGFEKDLKGSKEKTGMILVKETVVEKIHNEKDKTLTEQKQFLATLSAKIRGVVEKYTSLLINPTRCHQKDKRIKELC
jgi:hypothetical protein